MIGRKESSSVATSLEPNATNGVVERRQRKLLARVRGIFGEAFSSLSHRNFRLLYQGIIVTQTGFWMQQVAMGWLVLELSNSPLYLGLNGFLRAIPMLLFSPFGGVLADRLERRKAVMGSQVVTMSTVTSIFLLIVTGKIEVWHLMVASFIQGVSMAVNNPARQAMLSDLVPKEQLANAIALNSMSINVSRIVGPTLAGIILGAVGAAGCFGLQSLTYIWSVFNVAQIRISEQVSRARKGSVLQSLVEGFRYSYQTDLIRTVLLLVAVPTMVAMPYMQILPAYARDTLGTDASGLGVMFAALGIGALGCNFTLAATARYLRRRGLILLVAGITFGASLVLLGLVKSLPLVLALLLFAGGANGINMALASTLIQECTPGELRGRVMSLHRMLTFGLTPLGVLPAGWIAEHYGAHTSILISGALAGTFTTIMLLTRPKLREIA